MRTICQSTKVYCTRSSTRYVTPNKMAINFVINAYGTRAIEFFQGMEYFRNLLALLERTYKIKIDDYLLVETPSTKALGYGGLALISAQKIFLFLGDLARYKETTEESCTYTNARQ